MASKGTEVKKTSNTKSILSQSNGTAEKSSSKSSILKSPTALKTSPKATSVRNGTDTVKLNNLPTTKKMETGSPPKVTRSPSARSITPPNKNLKTSPTKTNGLERQNSQGDCCIAQNGKNDLIVDNGVIHSNGNCDVMLSMESKLKENHFAIEATQKEENAPTNGHAEPSTNSNEIEPIKKSSVKGDSVEVHDIITLKIEQDLASGDSKCVKEKIESKSSTVNGALDDKNELFEDAKSDLNESLCITKANGDSEVTSKFSPNSSATTDCTECSAETAKLLPEPEVTKQSIRLEVWEHLDKNDLVIFPRPCQGRIPNFKGAPTAAEKLIALDVFKNSKTIKVNPDKPQEMVRFHTLEFGKRLLVPVPRLREGLFQAVVPPSEASKYQLQQASQRFGMKKWSRPISVDDKVSIDLIVLGSVVVDKKGRRLGKGEGFADLEFAMLMKMNAVDEKTVIVTTVHDDQVYDELPEHLFKEHDVPVDWIITPTQVIEVKEKLPRPTKILWNILSNRRILEIPILQKLREEELSEGQDCVLKDTDSDVGEKPYIQRFNRRRRFNYNRSTGDPVRDNKMYPSAPPRQQYHRAPRRYIQQPPPPNHVNNYGPPMMRNDQRHVYYHEPYATKQPMGRPRMQEPRPRSMSRGNKPMNRPQSIGRRPQNQNRQMNTNRSRSMSRLNGPHVRNDSRPRMNHMPDVQYMNSPHMTKSVEVQTVNKSRARSTYLKRKKAPIEFSLRVKNIGMGVRVRDLKVALNERGIKPRDITWRGYKGFAFLHFVKPAGKENSNCLNVDEVIKTLQDLPLPPKDKKTLVIEPLQIKKEESSDNVEVDLDDVIKGTTTDILLEKTIAA